MNLIDFLSRAKPRNGITLIDADMMDFKLGRSLGIELAKLFGSEVAKQMIDAATPEYNRIRSIIDRVQLGIDYFMSNEALAEFESNYSEDNSNAFVDTGRITQFAKKGRQEFAINGSIAYDITERIIYDVSDDVAVYRRPFKLYKDGVQYLNYEFPDEGRGGLAMVTCISRPDREARFHVGISSCGFIYTSELNLSAQQIANNIADEIDDGATHLTGGMPGWA